MNQERLMQLIRKNLAATAARQRQSEARGKNIDHQMKEIAVAQERIQAGFGRGMAVSDSKRGQHR